MFKKDVLSASSGRLDYLALDTGVVLGIKYVYNIEGGAKGAVCGPEGARLADKRVSTKLRKCHLFLPSPIHACSRHGPWATS